jgi:thioredoxin-like negative regulator of GroEL
VKEMYDISRDIVILFTTKTCSNCPQAKKIYEKFFSDKETEYIIMDAHENKELSDLLNIRAVPSLLFIKDGVEVHRILGTPSLEKLQNTYNEYTGENNVETI